MNVQLNKLAHCSGPFWPDAQYFRENIAAPVTRAILSDFISLLQSTTGNSLLVSLIRNISDRSTHLSSTFASTGQAFRATLAPDQHEPLSAALQLVLDGLEDLPTFSLGVDLEKPFAFRMDPAILPKSSRVFVQWYPPHLQLVTNSFDAKFLVTQRQRKLSNFVTGNGQAISRFYRAGSVSVRGDSNHSIFSPLDLNPAESINAHSLSSLRTAQDLLTSAAPEYATWVRQVVRYVVLTKAPASGFTSGSDRFNPGVIAMSYPIDVLRVAESLVHEAAHQYYFLADSATELCDPNHDALYYSPLRKSRRTLDNILLAHHAAANIVCLYHLLRARHSDFYPDDVSLTRAVDDFKILSAHLLNNGALTDAGRSVFEPIYNLIIERGWTNSSRQRRVARR